MKPPVWRKSSHSANSAGQCVEVASIGRWFAIRDSKNPEGPMLELSRRDWRGFLAEFGSTS